MAETTNDRMAEHRRRAEETAHEQRRIQQVIDRIDRQRHAASDGSDGAGSRTTRRHHPVPPMPKQHLEKPGRESDLDPRPEYAAPDYEGSGKLRGMVALVTGGDSGIGRAVAVLFAREGADVAIAYLNEHEDAEETGASVEAEGGRYMLLCGDVRDSSFCDDAVHAVIDAWGRLDVLVNNAAFQEHVSSLEDLSDEHLDMTLRTNVGGYVSMARAALPHLSAGASIINTGSETGFFGQPMLLDYSATKGAIHAFTRALATNLAPKGIRVNAVAPGPVWTPLNPADQPPDAIEQFGGGTSLQRPAQPEELAPAYVFLAAPSCSSYVTGAVIPVMGGVTGSA